MGRFVNLSGNRYGRWTVQRVIPREAGQINLKWECLCDCGVIANITGNSLKSGISTSCGCMRKERLIERNTTHGLSHTKEYNSWAAMHRRCNDPEHTDYEYYGGRGISVCKEWGDFEIFLSDMGNRPEGCTIDRVNNDGNYNKSNCQWATNEQQRKNTSRSLNYTVNGVTKSHTEWAKSAGIGHVTLKCRIDAGWTIEQACTAPKNSRRSK